MTCKKNWSMKSALQTLKTLKKGRKWCWVNMQRSPLYAIQIARIKSLKLVLRHKKWKWQVSAILNVLVSVNTVCNIKRGTTVSSISSIKNNSISNFCSHCYLFLLFRQLQKWPFFELSSTFRQTRLFVFWTFGFSEVEVQFQLSLEWQIGWTRRWTVGMQAPRSLMQQCPLKVGRSTS